MARELVRLQKFLSECGVASRRKAEELISGGKVRVNGEIVKELGTKVDPERDIVKVRNKTVKQAPKGVLVFYKPRQVISTLSDPEGRPCVGDYITKHYKSYFPVGRLDWDTSGLMILTNDGELTDALLHPRNQFNRTYHARVEGSVSQTLIDKMKKGVRLQDGLATARGEILRQDEKSTWLELTVQEGRNHLIKRMMQKLKHPVMKLKRVSFGPFELGRMQPGDMRPLTQKQYVVVRSKILGGRSGRR
ncbi:MAG: rRNA pseudouridine synthase [Deltaproteobacteria bacterium]|nr:rRNA pseudouridine synthase [Deltaproteobacteria bacterium]